MKAILGKEVGQCNIQWWKQPPTLPVTFSVTHQRTPSHVCETVALEGHQLAPLISHFRKTNQEEPKPQTIPRQPEYNPCQTEKLMTSEATCRSHHSRNKGTSSARLTHSNSSR